MESTDVNPKEDSYFDGSLLTLVGVSILAVVMTLFSFGILYPWAMCLSFGWKINHTVVEGRRLKFIGQPMSLFLNWIKWLLLCIITFGIYGFWVSIALEKWKVKNTIFEN